MMIRPHIPSVVGRELEGRQAGRGHKPKSRYRAELVIMGDILPVSQSTMQLVDTTGHCWSQTFNDNL